MGLDRQAHRTQRVKRGEPIYKTYSLYNGIIILSTSGPGPPVPSPSIRIEFGPTTKVQNDRRLRDNLRATARQEGDNLLRTAVDADCGIPLQGVAISVENANSLLRCRGAANGWESQGSAGRTANISNISAARAARAVLGHGAISKHRGLGLVRSFIRSGVPRAGRSVDCPPVIAGQGGGAVADEERLPDVGTTK